MTLKRTIIGSKNIGWKSGESMTLKKDDHWKSDNSEIMIESLPIWVAI
jgi:hypothetical protein